MNKAIITNSGIILFFCVVLLLLSAHGARNRLFLPSPRIAAVPEPSDALSLWNDSGVKGRTLIIFDRSFNITYPGSLAPEMTPDKLSVKDSYVYLSTVKNITRKIYHVVPGPAWEQVKRTLADFPMVSFDGTRFTMVVYDGIPLSISKMQDIPAVTEPVLVQINGDHWTDDDIADILQVLGTKRIVSDCMTISGSFSDRSLKALKAYEQSPS